MESHLYQSPKTAMLTQDSPYGSLAPHIPTHSHIPSVSDSSDEDDQEFMQGLVFDASARRDRNAPLHASYPPPYASYPPPSLHGALDYTDSPPPEPLPHGAPTPASSAAISLASSILQYSQAGSEGAGALLSSLGQSMFTTVMNNMNQAAARDAAHHHTDAAATHYRDDLSDDFEPDATRRTPERRVRRRPKRPARSVAGPQQEFVIESEDVPSNGDFEFISDDEISE
ncbi:hypothetical protein FHG87_002425 [Trinorchestia longiramus]|nr:hypothetical protein FHG87_002425 [Trinorchestia longiramus]